MNPKSVSLILYIALISLQLNEQEKNCTDETILGKKGIWKQSDFITSFYESRNKEKYGEAQKIVSNIADIFINLIPEPAGMEPKWWGSERNPVIPGGPLAYDFNSDYLKYFCAKNTNELLLGFETGTWIYAHINSGGYVFQMYDTLEIKGKPELIYQLPKRAGTWEGHTWFLQPDIGKHSALGRSVILLRPGEVPYHFLT